MQLSSYFIIKYPCQIKVAFRNDKEKRGERAVLKIGIFGGTFNPVHYGHLINAELVREKFSLDRVLFVPSKHPVHKELEGSISSAHRVKMLELALAGNSEMGVSTIEVDKETPSYTIYTVDELKTQYPGDQLYLIIGYDSYLEIDTWKNYRELLGKVDLVVMKRNGVSGRREDLDEFAERIFFAENPLIELSSTEIRNRIREGLSVAYMLPENVLDYITKEGFYRS
jgi:nicotinate-nucleotide adenylyltransferase